MIAGFSVLANFFYLLLTAIESLHYVPPVPRDESVHYMTELQEPSPSDVQPLVFWQQRRSVYNKVAPIAEDLIAAPASQAYVERIFSLCGMLSSGRHNRMLTSLEMRVCLKLNSRVLTESGFH